MAAYKLAVDSLAMVAVKDLLMVMMEDSMVVIAAVVYLGGLAAASDTEGDQNTTLR